MSKRGCWTRPPNSRPNAHHRKATRTTIYTTPREPLEGPQGCPSIPGGKKKPLRPVCAELALGQVLRLSECQVPGLGFVVPGVGGAGGRPFQESEVDHVAPQHHDVIGIAEEPFINLLFR